MISEDTSDIKILVEVVDGGSNPEEAAVIEHEAPPSVTGQP